MKIHKKSLLIGSATLVLLGGCSLFNTQNTSQKTESETTTTEISKADLAKFEIYYKKSRGQLTNRE